MAQTGLPGQPEIAAPVHTEGIGDGSAMVLWCFVLRLQEGLLDFTQNPGKVMDDITFVRSHWWLVSEGFSLSTANSDVQKLPATLYHRIADSLAYAA